ncbi:Alpha/Beta hydrolase protein [Amanita rubescens]|nr:Alpha/Beta hydrolase protein [Amanita rubescens]KAF8348795.1 Alpha/Beta hydrolase protein [Amanita rubescens]
MSNLYRSAISARLAKLPQDLPPGSGGDEDNEEDEAADIIGALPGSGMGPPAMPRRTLPSRPPKPPNPAFSSISGSSFFDSASQVAVPSRGLDFRVYYTPPKYADGTVMICHHGAGYGGLSFACMAKEVKDLSNGECGILAPDARRHGKTVQLNQDGPEDEDLSIDRLATDLVELVQVMFPEPTKASSLLLVGHSMGGSVMVLAVPLLLEKKYRITGVAVLDVVEGSALEALPHMHNLLNTRPDGFDSIEEAIEWHVSTNTIQNPNSARVSIPSTFKHIPNAFKPYQWRTPLRSTAPYWTSWFTDLSKKFLAARTARLLILAGTDRLDRELMVGQMQGKFQMEVVPGVGHMLHEDNPTRLAEILAEFWKRNEKVIAGIKKVGDL